MQLRLDELGLLGRVADVEVHQYEWQHLHASKIGTQKGLPDSRVCSVNTNKDVAVNVGTNVGIIMEDNANPMTRLLIQRVERAKFSAVLHVEVLSKQDTELANVDFARVGNGPREGNLAGLAVEQVNLVLTNCSAIDGGIDLATIELLDQVGRKQVL